MKDYRQIIADDNIHIKKLYKTIESQQQEIKDLNEVLRLAKKEIKFALEYTEFIPSRVKLSNALSAIDKALGGKND